MTLAILSEFVPNQGNAWKLTVDSLGRFFEQALTHSARIHELPTPPQPLLELSEGPVPAPVQETIAFYLESARLLGQRTAELHRPLAAAASADRPPPQAFALAGRRGDVAFLPLRQRFGAPQGQHSSRRCADSGALGPFLASVGVGGLLEGVPRSRSARRVFAPRSRRNGHLARLLYAEASRYGAFLRVG